MLNSVGEIRIDIRQRECCVFIAEKGEPISECGNVETWSEQRHDRRKGW